MVTRMQPWHVSIESAHWAYLSILFKEATIVRYVLLVSKTWPCMQPGCLNIPESILLPFTHGFMTNHVHLLATPFVSDGVSHMMQALGRRYVRYFNREYQRTGTLWEGRFKSSLVQTETYLLQCQRYIELNPVRANMVSEPGDYMWSGIPQGQSKNSTDIDELESGVIPVSSRDSVIVTTPASLQASLHVS